MTILYLSHRVPYPPDKGEKTRAFHMIRELAGDHRIHLCTLADDARDLHHDGPLREYCADVSIVLRAPGPARLAALAALPFGTSMAVAASRSRRLQRIVDEQLARHRFDAIIVYSVVMASYVPASADIPVLIDYVDVDSEKWRSYSERAGFPLSFLYTIEARRLAMYERVAGRSASGSVVVSKTEAELLRRVAPDLEPIVISNGVDTDHFHPGESGPLETRAPLVVFTGVMDYPPNVDAVLYFARDVWPRVRATRPDAEFLIVGRRPTAAVRSLTSVPGIRVTGEVPDVRPHFAAAALAIAPFRIARGIQNKILEAMASGVPVVSTRLAIQGMPGVEGRGLTAAEDAEGLASAIVDLIARPDQRSTQGRLAREYVERHHRWSEHGRQWNELLHRVTREHSMANSPG